METRSNVLSVAEDGDASAGGNDGLRGHARPDTHDAGRDWRWWMSTPHPGRMANGRTRATCPIAGDELHHFGWNACSSCLCPYSPHPHMERRYLVVPGMRSSRIHIIDTKPDPRQPKIVKVIEPETVMQPHGLQPSAHRALRAGRHLSQRAGLAGRRRPGRHLHHGPGDIRSPWPLGAGSRAAVPGLRLLVASGLTTR